MTQNENFLKSRAKKGSLAGISKHCRIRFEVKKRPNWELKSQMRQEQSTLVNNMKCLLSNRCD